jgi:hypothetical protein
MRPRLLAIVPMNQTFPSRPPATPYGYADGVGTLSPETVPSDAIRPMRFANCSRIVILGAIFLHLKKTPIT